MKKILIWMLILLSLTALLLRFSHQWAEVLFGIKQTSGISVLSEPGDAAVFLDGQQVGKTPYEDKNLAVGDYVVKIEKGAGQWEGKVKLTAGALAVINRDLAVDSASSAGEILTLEKGTGLTVISNPREADVEVDGKIYGKTPLILNIDSGAHIILISRTNYLKRSIPVTLPEGFNLTMAVDLAFSEANLTVSTAPFSPTPAPTKSPVVYVKQTPTGFLRVRDKPNLNGKEIARVKPGDSLVLIENMGAWVHVRLSDGAQGYVSSAFITIQTDNF